MEVLWKYYGVDWAAMITAMWGMHLLSRKKQSGFLVCLISCFFWIAFNGLVQSVAGILANLILIYINFRGYLNWAKNSES